MADKAYRLKFNLSDGQEIDAGTFIAPQGSKGQSAYEIAVANGFEGTEEEWLESLKGEIDSAFSTTSTNPLQNKVVTAEFNARLPQVSDFYSMTQLIDSSTTDLAKFMLLAYNSSGSGPEYVKYPLDVFIAGMQEAISTEDLQTIINDNL